ncbi:hypothetical protein EDD22DRAFT_387021 [Suillus occidentalis]|nr:hypothetical protein EDD22DRAFT_387021 [Suillus occidentalis]
MPLRRAHRSVCIWYTSKPACTIGQSHCLWEKEFGTEAMRFIVNHAFKYFGLQRISLEVTKGNARASVVYRF